MAMACATTDGHWSVSSRILSDAPPGGRQRGGATPFGRDAMGGEKEPHHRVGVGVPPIGAERIASGEELIGGSHDEGARRGADEQIVGADRFDAGQHAAPLRGLDQRQRRIERRTQVVIDDPAEPLAARRGLLEHQARQLRALGGEEDEVVQDRGERLRRVERRDLAQPTLHALAHLGEEMGDDGAPQSVLGAEVVVDQRLLDARGRGDVTRHRPVEPVLAEGLQRGLDDALAGGAGAGRACAAAAGSVPRGGAGGERARGACDGGWSPENCLIR